jgi:putative transposase
MSDGTRIANHRCYKTAQAKLRRAQRKVARRQNKKSQRRHKAILLLQKAHRHVANQRKDFQHQLSTQPVQNFGTIAVEDSEHQRSIGGSPCQSNSRCCLVYLPQYACLQS